MATKTFVLGTGAQKAGTTWLYEYLAASPAFVEGYRKEYHVFDSIDLETEWRARDRIAARAKAAATAARQGRAPDAAALHRMSMYVDPGLYFDYFAGLLSRGPDLLLTADMTPAHALLGADRFRQIRTEFAARGIRTVAVFLMRDPVERLWSQVRMQKSRRPERIPVPSEEAVLKRFRLPAYDLRSRYDRTLAALEEGFDPADVHVEFYESLFTEEAVGRVCQRLGIPMHAPELDVRRNAVPATTTLPESTVRTVAAHFADVYAAVAARFPEVDLTELWPSARHVL